MKDGAYRSDVAALWLAGVWPAGVTPVPVETPRPPPHRGSYVPNTVPQAVFFSKWPRLSKHDGGGSQLIILFVLLPAFLFHQLNSFRWG